ncbi:MAG: ATP synthase subunit I [Ilumatobacteraceae bacterium]|nr:ATP synthase subunit I [Ilumatobacteraceae bacterium]
MSEAAQQSTASPLTTRFDGPAPEWSIGRDMVRRGLLAGPIIVALCAVIWGGDGLWSSLYGVAIVLVNFALSAALIAVGARISLAVMMGAVLFGYLIRLGLIFAAVWFVQDESWISFPALGATIIVTHLGLLAWELRHVSLSLAFPGLKPEDPSATVSPTAAPPSDNN